MKTIASTSITEFLDVEATLEQGPGAAGLWCPSCGHTLDDVVARRRFVVAGSIPVWRDKKRAYSCGACADLFVAQHAAGRWADVMAMGMVFLLTASLTLLPCAMWLAWMLFRDAEVALDEVGFALGGIALSSLLLLLPGLPLRRRWSEARASSLTRMNETLTAAR